MWFEAVKAVEFSIMGSGHGHTVLVPDSVDALRGEDLGVRGGGADWEGEAGLHQCNPRVGHAVGDLKPGWVGDAEAITGTVLAGEVHGGSRCRRRVEEGDTLAEVVEEVGMLSTQGARM
jgi:hypothetical protein